MNPTPCLGEIRMFPYARPPRDWARCDGGLLPIQPNQALFTLLGTFYGGNGTTNFALPDLRSRVPLCEGQGESSYELGQTGGEEKATVTMASLTPHTHDIQVSTQVATTSAPTLLASLAPTDLPSGAPPGLPADADVYSLGDGPSDQHTLLSPSMIGMNFSPGNAHPNRQPYLAMHFYIALSGFFPQPG